MEKYSTSLLQLELDLGEGARRQGGLQARVSASQRQPLVEPPGDGSSPSVPACAGSWLHRLALSILLAPPGERPRAPVCSSLPIAHVCAHACTLHPSAVARGPASPEPGPL